jgi:hypothetical protein
MNNQKTYHCLDCGIDILPWSVRRHKLIMKHHLLFSIGAKPSHVKPGDADDSIPRSNFKLNASHRPKKGCLDILKSVLSEIWKP